MNITFRVKVQFNVNTHTETQLLGIPWAANIVNWRCSVAVHASLVLFVVLGVLNEGLWYEFKWSWRRAWTAEVSWSMLIWRGFSDCKEPRKLFFDVKKIMIRIPFKRTKIFNLYLPTGFLLVSSDDIIEPCPVRYEKSYQSLQTGKKTLLNCY